MDSEVFDAPAHQTVRPPFWLAMIVWCVLFMLVVRYALRLKTVFANETGLRISGYLSEIEVPFSDVASIKPNWFFKNATLQLNAPSDFGAKIRFIPRRQVETDQGNRLTLDVLRELIDRT